MNIGALLKEARLERNLTITEVSIAIKVNKKYIQAMEDGNFLVLPSVVYAKGFLKAYAIFLELDPKPMIEELLQFYSVKEPVKRVFMQKKPEVKFSIPHIEAPRIEMPKIVIPKINIPKISLPKLKIPKVNIGLPFKLPNFDIDWAKKIEIDPMVGRYIIAGLVVLILMILLVGNKGNIRQRQIKNTVKSIKATLNTPKAVPIKEVKEVTPKPEVKQAGPVLPEKRPGVKIEAAQKTWVSIISDGVDVYAGTLDIGRWVNYRGKEVKVKTSNAAAIRIYLNGVSQGLMGGENESVERTYYPYK